MNRSGRIVVYNNITMLPTAKINEAAVQQGFGFPNGARSYPPMTYGAERNSPASQREKEIMDYFGPPRVQGTRDPFSMQQTDHKVLRDGYEGYNEKTTNIIIWRIREEAADILKYVAPLTEMNKIGDSVSWYERKYTPATLVALPEETVAPAVTSNWVERRATISRHGRGLIMEGGMFMTPEGKQHYQYSIQQIATATLEHMICLVYYNLLGTKDGALNLAEEMGLPRSSNTHEEIIERELDMWAILSKKGHAYSTLEDHMSFILKKRQVTPDCVILPAGTKRYYRFAKTDEQDYSKGGPDAAARWYSGKSPIDMDAKIRVIESSPMHIEDGQEARDPLVSRRSIGDFWDDNFKDAMQCAPEYYRSSIRNTIVFNYDRDDFDVVSHTDVIKACPLWGPDGRFTDYADYFFNGYDPLKDYLDDLPPSYRHTLRECVAFSLGVPGEDGKFNPAAFILGSEPDPEDVDMKMDAEFDADTVMGLTQGAFFAKNKELLQQLKTNCQKDKKTKKVYTTVEHFKDNYPIISGKLPQFVYYLVMLYHRIKSVVSEYDPTEDDEKFTNPAQLRQSLKDINDFRAIHILGYIERDLGQIVRGELKEPELTTKKDHAEGWLKALLHYRLDGPIKDDMKLLIRVDGGADEAKAMYKARSGPDILNAVQKLFTDRVPAKGNVKHCLQSPNFGEDIPIHQFTREFAEWLIGLNIPVPLDFRCARPNIICEMGDAIMLKGGAETIQVIYKNPKMILGQDVADILVGNFSIYTGVAFRQRRNVFVCRNVTLSRYCRIGGGTRAWDRNNTRHVNDFKNGNFIADYLVIPMIPGKYRRVDDFDLTGMYPLLQQGQVHKRARHRYKDPHYPNAEQFCELWGIGASGVFADTSYQQEHINNRCHQIPVAKTYRGQGNSAYIGEKPGRTHFGRNYYRGIIRDATSGFIDPSRRQFPNSIPIPV